MPNFVVRVLRVDQSRMNPNRWCLELECGHEVWITAKKRPTRQRINCPTCASGFDRTVTGRTWSEAPHA
jgi:hypothetical protein